MESINRKIEEQGRAFQQSLEAVNTQISALQTQRPATSISGLDPIGPPLMSSTVSRRPSPSRESHKSDSEGESEVSEVSATALKAQAERRALIKQALSEDGSFALEVVQEAPAAMAKGMESLFGAWDKASTPTLLPLQPPLVAKLGQFAEAKAQAANNPRKSKYNVDRVLARVYRLPSIQEDNWSKPHTYPTGTLSLHP